MEHRTQKFESGTDFMRIAASFFVVLLHACAEGSRSVLIVNCICRFSVPVFVLISGRYLLHGGISRSVFLKKSLRFIGLMLLWSAIYYSYFSLTGRPPEKSFPVYLLTEPMQLWYFYMIACLYLLSPILSVFTEAAPKNIYVFALAVTALLGSPVFILLRAECFPILTEIMDKTKLPVELGFIFLFLLGDFFQRYKPKLSLWSWALLFLLGTGFTVGGTMYLSRGGAVNELLMSFFAPGAMCAAIGFFGFFNALFSELSLSEKTENLLHRAASATLGIYLVHPLVLDILDRFVASSSRLLLSALYAVIAYLTSALFSLLIRRIPAVRHIM